MNRYAAKLLFQFRVRGGSTDNQKRLCEERIILLSAASARTALAKAKRRGAEARHSYLNGRGHTVYFEFIGVRELLHLGAGCEPDEVWYEIGERLRPKERKRKLIPAESSLQAIRFET
jgi:hypothetical protein